MIDPDRGKETLRSFKARWWRDYVIPNLEANAQAGYSRGWKSHIEPKLGDCRLRDLTPAKVEQFRAQLEANGVGAPTVRKALVVLARHVERGRPLGARREERSSRSA
jgi:hypothetical protein